MTLPPASPAFRADGDHRFTLRDANIEYPVYRDGVGRAVIVMHELPGMSAGCLALASRVMNAGYTVYMPLFFGAPGENLTGRWELFKRLRAVCVAREFECLASDKTSPVTTWLRALARRAHAECGGAGIGVIGMCFSGGFILGMLLEPSVLVPVMCQPALPLTEIPTPIPSAASRRRGLNIAPEDLAVARQRAVSAPVLGYRFSNDGKCPEQRFQRLEQEFKDNFHGVRIRSGAGTRFPKDAHSVLTTYFSEDPADPTAQALQEILDRLAERLAV